MISIWFELKWDEPTTKRLLSRIFYITNRLKDFVVMNGDSDMLELVHNLIRTVKIEFISIQETSFDLRIRYRTIFTQQQE